MVVQVVEAGGHLLIRCALQLLLLKLASNECLEVLFPLALGNVRHTWTNIPPRLDVENLPQIIVCCLW